MLAKARVGAGPGQHGPFPILAIRKHTSVWPLKTRAHETTPTALLCRSVGSGALAGHRARKGRSHMVTRASLPSAPSFCPALTRTVRPVFHFLLLQPVQTTHCSSGHATPRHQSVPGLALVRQMTRCGMKSLHQRGFRLPLGMSAAQLSRFRWHSCTCHTLCTGLMARS